MSLSPFVPTPKFEDYRERFKDHFRLERRADGVLLAQAHTIGRISSIERRKSSGTWPTIQDYRRRSRERSADSHRVGRALHDGH